MSISILTSTRLASLAFLATLTTVTAALAHTRWADGSVVPEWVSKACCGPSDVHHLTPDQVHAVEGGFRVDGVTKVIPYSDALPSQDGDFWAFYSSMSSGEQHVYCFFAPRMGV